MATTYSTLLRPTYNWFLGPPCRDPITLPKDDWGGANHLQNAKTETNRKVFSFHETILRRWADRIPRDGYLGDISPPVSGVMGP